MNSGSNFLIEIVSSGVPAFPVSSIRSKPIGRNRGGLSVISNRPGGSAKSRQMVGQYSEAGAVARIPAFPRGNERTSILKIGSFRRSGTYGLHRVFSSTGVAAVLLRPREAGESPLWAGLGIRPRSARGGTREHRRTDFWMERDSQFDHREGARLSRVGNFALRERKGRASCGPNEFPNPPAWLLPPPYGYCLARHLRSFIELKRKQGMNVIAVLAVAPENFQVSTGYE